MKLVMQYAKKNLSLILVILLMFLSIAIVVWIFNKKIQNIEKKKPVQTMLTKTSHHSS